MALKPCNECKKEISTEANPCPHCGKKSPHGASSVVKYGGGFLVLMIGIPVFVGMIQGLSGAGTPGVDDSTVSVASAEEPGPEAHAVQATDPPIVVDALKLWKDYEANEVAADGVYKGRRLEVTGTVASIDKDFLDNPVIKFVSPNQFMQTDATLDKSAAPRAARVKKGDRMTLLCEGAGRMVGEPHLSNCAFAN